MKKSMWFYDFATGVLKWVFKLLFRTKTKGLENENVDGPVIYCVNHISAWDPVIVACETKRTINFMGKKELFSIPVLGFLLRALGAFPIDRSGNDLAAMKQTISALQSGARICLFPQGTRCPDVEPSETETKNGVAMLARHSKATIVPVGLYTKNYRVRLFRKVYVTLGKPRSYEELGFTGSREDYDRVTSIVFDDICKLCDASKEEANAGKR